MKGDNYYPNPTFPGVNTTPEETVFNEQTINLPEVRSNNDVQNILMSNIGKMIKIYCSFPNSENKDKIFDGIIESSGLDHVMISNRSTGEWQLIKLDSVNYFVFEEKIISNK